MSSYKTFGHPIVSFCFVCFVPKGRGQFTVESKCLMTQSIPEARRQMDSSSVITLNRGLPYCGLTKSLSKHSQSIFFYPNINISVHDENKE